MRDEEGGMGAVDRMASASAFPRRIIAALCGRDIVNTRYLFDIMITVTNQYFQFENNDI